MSASSSLSVELWQTVLRYSIGIADFLDPDAFEGLVAQQLVTDKTCSHNDEKAYWSAERNRTKLQLVSQSWNSYLRQFEHRFVRMFDIRHGTVNPVALRKAIRVSFGRYQCDCIEYCAIVRPSALGLFESFCWQMVEEAEKMDMQIADMMDERFKTVELIPYLQKFSRVITFIGPSFTYSGYFARVVNSLPSLRHFYGKGFWGVREHGSITKLSSSNLVTVSFHNRTRGRYSEITWDFPNLRHLMLKDDNNETLSEFVTGALLPITRAVGSQLLSLILYHCTGNYELPREIWDLCPRLTTLRTGMSLTTPPPFFHPINLLIVSHEAQLQDIKPPPEWLNLKRVVIEVSWWGMEPATHILEGRADTVVEYINRFSSASDVQ